jgi:hypothetical protein
MQLVMWKRDQSEPRRQENNGCSEQRHSEDSLIASSSAHRDPDENQKKGQRKYKIFVKFAPKGRTARPVPIS